MRATLGKRTLSLLLAAAMCLSLMGCADSASSTGGETENGADTAVEDGADTAVEDAAEGVEDAAEGGADTAVDENQEVTEAYQALSALKTAVTVRPSPMGTPGTETAPPAEVYP